MLQEFIDSVLIIDDNEDEIKDLQNILEEKDIWVKYYHPEQCVKKIKTRKIIFMDLHIDKTAGDKLKAHISKIRKILKTIVANEPESYGLVVWTNHIKEIDILKNSIKGDENYTHPTFIVGLSKLEYSKKNSYSTLFEDLETILKESVAANFFINWSNLINQGKDKAIISIFELVPDYQKQDKNLEFLLFKMAKNYTGIPFENIDNKYPLSIDAIKAFNDLLVSNINSLAGTINLIGQKENSLFVTNDNSYGYFASNELTTSKKDISIKNIETNANLTQREKTSDVLQKTNKEILEIYSNLNTKLLVDTINIQQDKIIPGNVYKVLSESSRLRHPDLTKNSIPIIIEMTPPCDFANSKTLYPKVMSGYITELDINNLPRKEKYYKEFWPVKIEDAKVPQVIIFDFSILGFVEESNLKNNEEFKLLFRVKDKLYADILQKMSAYTARLGLSVIR